MFEEYRAILAQKGTVRFSIHVQPNAPLTRAASVLTDGTIRIALAAPPHEGKANAALIRFLADTFGVAKSNVHIIQGLAGRRKLIEIS
ncbi:MAG TPA: DUF167 domain-containing protein [Candidatus Peribacteraceae bacterium]|nr:DUF167 domain-containing protein [Candidatus Peribacteraceae bacterium]